MIKKNLIFYVSLMSVAQIISMEEPKKLRDFSIYAFGEDYEKTLNDAKNNRFAWTGFDLIIAQQLDPNTFISNEQLLQLAAIQTIVQAQLDQEKNSKTTIIKK